MATLETEGAALVLYACEGSKDEHRLACEQGDVVKGQYARPQPHKSTLRDRARQCKQIIGEHDIKRERQSQRGQGARLSML